MVKIILHSCLIIFFSINILSQWQNVNNNFTSNVNINSIKFRDHYSGYAAGMKTSDSSGVIYRTLNGGTNWYEIEFFPKSARSVYLPSASEIFFVIHSHVWFSTNGGNSWIDRYMQGYDIYDITLQNSSMMYVCGFNESNSRSVLIRSSDRGFTWNFVFNLENSNKLFCIKFPTPIVGYACGENGQVRKVVEGVTNWNSMYSGTTRNLNAMYFFNDSTGYVVGNNSTILKTTNGGYPWVAETWNFNNADLRSIEFYGQNTGFICGSGGFIAKTTDGGNSWLEQSTSITSQLNKVICINKDTAYCAGNSGKFLKTYNGGNPIGINMISEIIPGEFSLKQNYPNPFNPVTTIGFDISAFSFVRLIIFDQAGKEIEALVNKQLSAGQYNYIWDASSYPSGIYFYRMEAVDPSTSMKVRETKKMVLIK